MEMNSGDVKPSSKNLLDFYSEIHKKTNRDYLARMMNEKVESMITARKFDFDYWDGERKYGFGGYTYIKGYWTKLAQSLIRYYSLDSSSIVLDVGCGKGFLLFELQSLLPGIRLLGFDISQYGLDNGHPELQAKLWKQNAADTFPLSSKSIDLCLSLNTLHNLNLKEVMSSLMEIERISKRSYLVVESFRNEAEMFNVQCWALTAKTLISTEDWEFLIQLSRYTGDYEFIFFE
jgi:SAM-dependent methyltransferase